MRLCTFAVSYWWLFFKAPPLILLFVFKVLQISWASQLSLFNLLCLRMKVQILSFHISVAGYNTRKSQRGTTQWARSRDLCSVTRCMHKRMLTQHSSYADLSPYFHCIIYTINPIILCSKSSLLQSVHCLLYANVAFSIRQLATIKIFHPGLQCELLCKAVWISVNRPFSEMEKLEVKTFFSCSQVPPPSIQEPNPLPFLSKWIVPDD